MELGAILKKARKEEGFTQSELAEKVGTHTQNISRMEKGDQNISFDLLNKVAHHLNRRINPDLLIK